MNTGHLAAKFVIIVSFLRRAVFTNGWQGNFALTAAYRPWAASPTGLGEPLIDLTWHVVNNTINRFCALLTKIQNGILPRVIPGSSGARQPRQATQRLPRHFGWLFSPASDACQFAAEKLSVLIAHPDMQVLIAADPRMGRILRPFCTLVGLAHPPSLQLPKCNIPPSRRKSQHLRWKLPPEDEPIQSASSDPIIHSSRLSHAPPATSTTLSSPEPPAGDNFAPGRR